MPLILGRCGTQYVATVKKLLSSHCGSHLVETYCKESNIADTNWLRYPSSYLIKIWLSVNLQSGVLVFRGEKERLIQLVDYLSVASPQSGLFLDWSRNKRYFELSHDWFPEWQCDFRSKK